MNNFFNDFSIFSNNIFSCINQFWNWYFNTILGELTIFVIIIGLFFYIINILVNLKR